MNIENNSATNAKRVPRRSPFIRYFADIRDGIVSTYLGMRLTIGYFFSKPFTMRYPEVKPVIPESHRGLHALDESRCTLCRLCMNQCPVKCIAIEGLGRAKDTLVLRYDVDYSKCLFCNLCAEVCPMTCVRLTEKYNLAAGTREACQLHLARPKSDDEIAAFKEMLAQKDAERKAKAAQKAKEQQEGPKAG